VAAALVNVLGRAIKNAGVGPLIAVALSAPMLAFYLDLVRLAGGGIDTHPRPVRYAGIDMTYMVIRIGETDYVKRLP